MEEVLDRIRIIPLVQVLLSEETIAQRATTLAKYLEHDGAQKDPIIVTPANESYIVLDGMHRVEALRILGCVDILAYCVDYENHKISLQSWDGLVDPEVRLVDLLRQEFGGPEHAIERAAGLAAARERVACRTAHFALCPGPTEGWLLRPREVRGPIPCDDLIYTLEHWEARLDREGIAIRYVANTRSEAQLREPGAGALVVRPTFTKAEVVSRTLQGKLFPRKTTRHVIDDRPLRIGVPLSLLREETDIAVKNTLLRAELRWRNEHGRIRYYPDSVFLFDE